MRSMLFVPGDRPERFAKAVASGADAIIIDLEDAVAPHKRPAAREAIAGYLANAARSVPVWVRINPVESSDALPDLAAVVSGRPSGIVLPKPRSADDVWRLDHWLEALEQAHGIATGSTTVLPLITESAASMLQMASYVKLPRRVTGLTWGAEDLAADLGALRNKSADGEYEFAYQWAKALCLTAAAAACVAAIDTVDTEIRDLPGIRRRAQASRAAGFVGKLAIHPGQIEAIHAAFTPTAAEIDWARRVLAAFENSPGLGAVALDGQLLDRPHARRAERILASTRPGEGTR
jgi:citrate lyase subunit beta/citryl-CoA lyase